GLYQPAARELANLPVPPLRASLPSRAVRSWVKAHVAHRLLYLQLRTVPRPQGCHPSAPETTILINSLWLSK
ncbi:MAG: hypothetical protein ACOYL2_12285, partial [Burkholderiaceae bacterium]